MRAADFTHDPAAGFDAHAFADRLLAEQDPRLRYVISRGRIGSGPAGTSPGKWRRYTGSNPHDHHVHVSVVAGKAGDDDRPWTLTAPPEADLTAEEHILLRQLHEFMSKEGRQTAANVAALRAEVKALRAEVDALKAR